MKPFIDQSYCSFVERNDADVVVWTAILAIKIESMEYPGGTTPESESKTIFLAGTGDTKENAFNSLKRGAGVNFEGLFL